MQDNKLKWKIRRRIIISTLVYCALGIGYLILKGEDTELNRSIANALILLSGSTISTYVVGATWEDKKTGDSNASGSK